MVVEGFVPSGHQHIGTMKEEISVGARPDSKDLVQIQSRWPRVIGCYCGTIGLLLRTFPIILSNSLAQLIQHDISSGIITYQSLHKRVKQKHIWLCSPIIFFPYDIWFSTTFVGKRHFQRLTRCRIGM
ncbi:hypothetical protein TNIN_459881 [Trichonephila inaurata madagascariensis]|uniref:Uncharacterized protein n=1 Tax=Trichonephila inaurata madagascariensis TaxID=2747483 RepID=A0A8X6YFV6_9ARAC|nr:hypothetical protein TNIN_459881 [Trichonephila inaurata madagascariensis]